MDRLDNYMAGRWIAGQCKGHTLSDPVTGEALVAVSSAGLDLPDAFDFARRQGGGALRALSYGERAALLKRIGEVLTANRESYFEIATANSGTVKADSAVDIDGAIYTVGQYARWGAGLGDARVLLDGEPASLAKEGAFQSQHVLTPTRGLALFINAFNFPAWGLWEKAAPALLSGVPVVIKPATATAWLTQRMVADVVNAGVLPAGALSVVCGSSAGLLDALGPEDVVSFTGSAETAREASSTSVGRARRSTTGHWPRARAARSSCASRTPTRLATVPSGTQGIIDALAWIGVSQDDPAFEGPYFRATTPRPTSIRPSVSTRLARRTTAT